ncbi:type II toxin-antitoxin system Phd/YefM family antitoxin [bacterium]|nr:type II toxin-antitoxin system Phd/YefM family antitoxin [bacterium]MBU1752355.1 type II toxin-antitoxin system Phd/YefM family antitoxin [bacterium]
MMAICTYSNASQNLDLLLEEVIKEGEARIKSKDGQIFVIRPGQKIDSALDVEGINLGISTNEIIQFIHEGRRMT